MKGRKFELADPSLGRRSKEEKIEMVYRHWESFQAEKKRQECARTQKEIAALTAYFQQFDVPRSPELEAQQDQEKIINLGYNPSV